MQYMCSAHVVHVRECFCSVVGRVFECVLWDYHTNFTSPVLPRSLPPFLPLSLSIYPPLITSPLSFFSSPPLPPLIPCNVWDSWCCWTAAIQSAPVAETKGTVKEKGCHYIECILTISYPLCFRIISYANYPHVFHVMIFMVHNYSRRTYFTQFIYRIISPISTGLQ